MNYKVGQVLYMTMPKSLKIIPIQVVEEVTRTNLNGTEKTHIVQFPDAKKTKVDIASLKGDLFADVKELRENMLTNATVSIDRMIAIASQLAKEEYDLEVKSIQSEAPVQVETNDDIIMVDLGNGVKAKMKTNELEKVAIQ